MGKGLQMMFKALGVEIAPEHIVMIQALIPQLPSKINEAAQAINAALANFDARLQALERAQKAHRDEMGFLNNGFVSLRSDIREVLENGRRTEPEPIGAGRRGRTRSGASGIDGAGNGGGSNDAGG